jgi:hypothetical protein
MTEPPNHEGFSSWRVALNAGQLTPGQIEVLQDMVANGEAETLEAAAVMLDWQDSVIQPPEHLWGF